MCLCNVIKLCSVINIYTACCLKFMPLCPWNHLWLIGTDLTVNVLLWRQNKRPLSLVIHIFHVCGLSIKRVIGSKQTNSADLTPKFLEAPSRSPEWRVNIADAERRPNKRRQHWQFKHGWQTNIQKRTSYQNNLSLQLMFLLHTNGILVIFLWDVWMMFAAIHHKRT